MAITKSLGECDKGASRSDFEKRILSNLTKARAIGLFVNEICGEMMIPATFDFDPYSTRSIYLDNPSVDF